MEVVFKPADNPSGPLPRNVVGSRLSFILGTEELRRKRSDKKLLIAPSRLTTELADRTLAHAETWGFDVRLVRVDPTPQSVISLLQKFRLCDASEPKDKVYSLLGLAHNPASAQISEIIKPDYDKSDKQVYIEMAWNLIRSETIWQFCLRCRGQRYTNIHGLPSWVPDFSAKPPSQLDIIENVSYWCAAGDLAFSCDLPPAPKIRLPLKCIKVDYVAEVDSRSGSLFVRVAEIALGLPAVYNRTHSYRTGLGKKPGLEAWLPLKTSTAMIQTAIAIVSSVASMEHGARQPNSSGNLTQTGMRESLDHLAASL
ncbi:MAG: hypothetical protein M1813_006615 [Trichoglossum hirsutum]|nr:MAG: hypothetical protein M1813_006615 [Trichoglossum hirsutum]